MEIKNVHFQKKAEGDIWIDRGTPIGNPYTHLKGETKAQFTVETREEAIEAYRKWLYKQLKSGNEEIISYLEQIKPDSILLCWCKPKSCHGEVIKSLLEKFTIDEIKSWGKK